MRHAQRSSISLFLGLIPTLYSLMLPEIGIDDPENLLPMYFTRMKNILNPTKTQKKNLKLKFRRTFRLSWMSKIKCLMIVTLKFRMWWKIADPLPERQENVKRQGAYIHGLSLKKTTPKQNQTIEPTSLAWTKTLKNFNLKQLKQLKYHNP